MQSFLVHEHINRLKLGGSALLLCIVQIYAETPKCSDLGTNVGMERVGKKRERNEVGWEEASIYQWSSFL